MTDEDIRHFRKVILCHICHEKFKKGDIRVRDHCHITGIDTEEQLIKHAICPSDLETKFQ